MQKKEGKADVSSNHAVSAMKFTYLQRFLKLGYSIFLSDVDIIFFQVVPTVAKPTR